MSIKNNPLLEEYTQELKKVWKTDEDMIRFCINNTQSLIKLSTGQLFVTDRLDIKKEFCFGYSSCGQGPSWDECMQNQADFRQNEADRFKEENLCGFDHYIQQLDSDGVRRPYLTSRYYQEFGANIVVLTWISEFDFDCGHARRDDCKLLEDCDKAAIKSAYIADKAAMEKRLDSYLKKYGTSKLKVWSYWIDA